MANVKARVERIEEETRGVRGQSGLKSADQQFLRNIKHRTVLTEAQEKWLSDIEERVFRDEEDD